MNAEPVVDYIRERALSEVVLEHLRETVEYVQEYEAEFVQIIMDKSRSEQHALSDKIRVWRVELEAEQAQAVNIDQFMIAGSSILSPDLHGLISKETQPHLCIPFQILRIIQEERYKKCLGKLGQKQEENHESNRDRAPYRRPGPGGDPQGDPEDYAHP